MIKCDLLDVILSRPPLGKGEVESSIPSSSTMILKHSC
jgi:hypothetical protein